MEASVRFVMPQSPLFMMRVVRLHDIVSPVGAIFYCWPWVTDERDINVREPAWGRRNIIAKSQHTDHAAWKPDVSTASERSEHRDELKFSQEIEVWLTKIRRYTVNGMARGKCRRKVERAAEITTRARSIPRSCVVS